jgi:hypothetical protein
LYKLPTTLSVGGGLCGVGGPVLTGLSISGPVKGLVVGLSSEDGVGGVSSVPLGGDGRSTGGSGGIRVLSSGLGGGGSLLGGLTLNLFRVTVEEQVRELIPTVGAGGSTGDGSLETENLSAEEVPHQTDGVTGFVVGWDGNIDKLEGSVSVAEGNDGDVDVSGLSDSLVVDTGVSDNDHSGLLERSSNVVGEVTGGESAGNGLSTSETGKLEHGSVTVRSGRDDGNVVRVLNGGEDTGGKDELLPGLAEVEDVDTWG